MILVKCKGMEIYQTIIRRKMYNIIEYLMRKFYIKRKIICLNKEVNSSKGIHMNVSIESVKSNNSVIIRF